MHRQKQFRRIKAMLDGHGYPRPRLYHLVLMSEIEATDAAPFLKALKALCLHLRSFGIATRWRAALERDDEKGLHLHVFLLTDATVHNTDAIINTKLSMAEVKTRTPKGGKRKSPAGWMRDMFARHGITFYLSQPKADMHRSGGTILGTRRNYARPDTPERIVDCIEWISYLAKARSKPDDIRGIYFSSRDSTHQRKQVDNMLEAA
ncbi:hypothetical protein KBK24_0137305 [Burkholderia sp. K24]|nr:hypothetical protein KBK24_0137305 [Burkholderia sp. K24]